MAQQVPENRWPLFRSLGSFRLADLPVDVVGASDVLHEKPSIVEGSDSFEENAMLKAKA